MTGGFAFDIEALVKILHCVLCCSISGQHGRHAVCSPWTAQLSSHTYFLYSTGNEYSLLIKSPGMISTLNAV